MSITVNSQCQEIPLPLERWRVVRAINGTMIRIFWMEFANFPDDFWDNLVTRYFRYGSNYHILCSYPRVVKLLDYVFPRRFLVIIWHSRTLETCRIGITPVKKGFNVHFVWNLCWKLKRKFKFIPPLDPRCRSPAIINFPFLNKTHYPNKVCRNIPPNSTYIAHLFSCQ